MTDTEYWNKMVEERNAFKKQNEALLKLLEVYKDVIRIDHPDITKAWQEYERTINGK